MDLVDSSHAPLDPHNIPRRGSLARSPDAVGAACSRAVGWGKRADPLVPAPDCSQPYNWSPVKTARRAETAGRGGDRAFQKRGIVAARRCTHRRRSPAKACDGRRSWKRLGRRSGHAQQQPPTPNRRRRQPPFPPERRERCGHASLSRDPAAAKAFGIRRGAAPPRREALACPCPPGSNLTGKVILLRWLSGSRPPLPSRRISPWHMAVRRTESPATCLARVPRIRVYPVRPSGISALVFVVLVPPLSLPLAPAHDPPGMLGDNPMPAVRCPYPCAYSRAYPRCPITLPSSAF